MKRGPSREVIKGFLQECALADLISFETNKTLRREGFRYDNVNLAEWNALNEDISSAWTQGKPLAYSLYRMARHIDIDKALQDVPAMSRSVSDQRMLLQEGVTRMFNEQTIAGSTAAEPNSFNGFEYLIRSTDDEQRVYPSSQLDLSALANTDASKGSQQQFFDLIDETVHRVDGHMADAAFCNSRTGLKVHSMARRLGLLGDNHDWLRKGWMFKNTKDMGATAGTKPMFVLETVGGMVPFYDIGINAAGDAPIIRNDYLDPVATTSDNTHIWFARFGMRHLHGLQTAAPSFRPIAKTLENRETARFRFVWICGIAMWHPRALALLGGIKV